MLHCRILTVGDDKAKKVQLLTAFKEGKLSQDYNPSFFENSTRVLTIDGTQVAVDILDSTGFDMYSSIRSSLYMNVDVVLLCFSISNKPTFRSIQSTWFPEVKHYLPTVPVFLVGTQSEKREEIGNIKGRLQSTKAALELSKKMKAVEYIECSAKTGQNVQYLFENAIRQVFPNKRVLSNTQQKKGESFWVIYVLVIVFYILFIVFLH
ncbi:Rho GTPase, putative [Entamoeba invadens IP1]|uniref:small monomeric GTPase n=1 Tax=Entamoeba invadens IP1 TaxID=370355 RepID=A0A0A1UCR0_ENTIV|nr:Rho GTPase, putative [Entamoeba invadens IP1]ELP91453.1 Rho GTPase, putative [Entamoeba invadens IP1]|eukprot:XP_004258224.1 Rho GTPase, putative [Entamoeba invadens IP1]